MKHEPRIPERQRLELSFVRARWLIAATVSVLAPLSGFTVVETGVLLVALAAGHGVIWRLAGRVGSLAAQRRLGVAAVAFDAAMVYGMALAADDGTADAVLGALVIVVAEASVRFAPLKAFIAAGVLTGGLAAVMGIRDIAADDPFDATAFLVLAVLDLLVGTMVGSAVREVYRQRVVTTPPADAGAMPIPEEAAALLTPRERQVLALIVRGYSNQRIAETLVVEPKTVKNHINRIYGKLEISNRYEAISAVLAGRRDDDGEER